MAAMKGHTDVVKLLVENDADVNIKTLDNRTALSYAKDEGYPEVVYALKKAGAKK